MNKVLAPVAALLISVSILLAGQGLQGTLLPVRASLEQFPTLAIGAMGATYFLGFTIGCLKGGELVGRVGHVRVFLAMTAIASASPLLHVLLISPISWGVLRFLTGFCFAVLYIVIESWLNDRADNTNRGVIFSTYSMITLTVLAVGQMMMLLYVPTGFELFIIASVLVSLGAVPIALSTSPTPAQPQTASIDIARLYQISPSGTVGCLVSGLANGAFWALAPVFASKVGNDISLAAWFMTSAVLGGAIAQWPLGLLSDRMGRRKVLVGVSLAGCFAGLALYVLGSSLLFSTANLLALIWGAFAFPLYAISVAYTNDYAEPHEYIMVSSGLLLMYGLGATIGPFVASFAMTQSNPGGMYAFAALMHLALVLFVAARFMRSRSVAEQHIAFSDALSSAQTASQVYEEELQVYEEELLQKSESDD